MLSARGLRKSFSEQKVLDDVSIDVTPGNLTAVLGPSGGGKSTLLRLLSFLDTPDAGDIFVDGKRAVKPVWPMVTLVFQQQFLWPHLSLRENLFLPIKGNAELLAARGNELLECLELLPLLHKRPWQLSIGERSRAALVRALLLSPRFLLLDEITAALDSERREVVASLLRAFTDSGGGVLLVTHDIEFAARFADETLRLERGKLQQVAPLSERMNVVGRGM